MNHLWSIQATIVFAAAIVLPVPSPAQEPACIEISRMALMARAKSSTTLRLRKQKAGNSYRAQLIFATRMLEIEPQNEAASEQLLALIPKSDDDPHQAVWLDLAELDQCKTGGFAESELKPLFALQYHLSRELARAVLLAPEKMPDYVAYARSSLTPDSDYTLQMQKVCRRKHRIFVEAVNKLPSDDKNWFVAKILNPETCHAIWLPEQ